MKPSNGFNPAHIHQYINPAPSREELICVKKDNGDVLKTNEQIIYDNYTNTKMQAIKTDYDTIRECLLDPARGFNALTGKIGHYIQPRTKGAGHGSTSRAFYARTKFLAEFIDLSINTK